MEHLFRHYITVYPTVTYNDANEEIFSGGADWRGRFQIKNELVHNSRGEEVLADALIYMEKETQGLQVGTKVTFEGVDYRIIAFKESLDYQSQTHHFEVWVKKWQIEEV